MGAVIIKNPIKKVESIHQIIKDVIKITQECTLLWHFDVKIAQLQSEIDQLRWDFPVDYKNTNTAEAKKKLRENIKLKEEEIKNLKIAKEKTDLSFFYILQGIQITVNGILIAYGVAAANVPSITLKGDGSIVIDADKKNEIYVSKDTNTGSPTGAIVELAEVIAFFAKVLKFGINVGKTISEFVIEGNKLE